MSENTQDQGKEQAAKNKDLAVMKLEARKKRLAKVKRSYTPQKGTGKMFHLVIESLTYKRGKRTSVKRTQIMEYPAFVHWLQNAAALNYSFAVLHDASGFYTQEQKTVIAQGLEGYCKRIPFDSLEYGVNDLCPNKTGINGGLNFFYVKRKKEVEKVQKQKEIKKPDWNFNL